MAVDLVALYREALVAREAVADGDDDGGDGGDDDGDHEGD